jgi:AcrR family transcriptional regulator
MGNGETKPGRREETKAANRAAILEAARAVFAERGYEASGVRHIVAATELSPGTFYNYFPDKESVFRAIVEESIARIRARVREARAGADSLESFVGDAYLAYFRTVADDPAMFHLMRRNAGAIRALLEEPLAAAGVGELVDDLRVRRELPPLDADYMARAMAGTALEIGMAMVERDPIDVEGAAAFATDLFVGGIERMARSR